MFKRYTLTNTYLMKQRLPRPLGRISVCISSILRKDSAFQVVYSLSPNMRQAVSGLRSVLPVAFRYFSLLTNKTLNLMRKEKFLMVLTSMAFMLLFGALNGYAQVDSDSSPTSFTTVDPSFALTGYDLVSVPEAITILKTQHELLNVDPSGMTEEEEANQGVRLSYYPHLLTLIQSYSDLSIALPSSVPYLEELVNAHKQGLGLDAAAIYQETIGLLEN